MTSKQRSLSRVARWSILTPVLAGSLFAYSAAIAQSTGSQTTVQEVTITAKHIKSVDGLAVRVVAAKDESIITQDYIKHTVGSANFAQIIDTLPGVTYSTEDPTGVLSSDFRLHGIPGDHVSFTLDGTPLNDTGNYAIYPGEYTPSEVIDHVTVNIGQTEVDSPSASALGGTVNIIGKTPPTDFGAYGSIAGGSYNYQRAYAEIDTGTVGPWGTRGYVSVNEVDANKYKGEGDIQGWGTDGKIYQPLNGNDFVAVAYTWQSNRPYFYESSTFSQIGQFGRSIDYNTQWAVPTAITGHADGIAGPSSGTAPGFEQGNDSAGNNGYWADHPNPVDFGDLRGQSRFTLLQGVTLTVDPYLFYTLANGGGTTALSEHDARLIGNYNGGVAPACSGGGHGVDLNGDGDCLDTVLAYSPSNTQTHRYGVNSSLIWDVNPENRFQLAYSFDYGRHRQTGEFTPIDQATGDPDNVFGGKAGYGPDIATLDGSILRKRDRFSIAELNQFAFNYIGKFDDDKIHINIGVRDPMFTRHLNQFCYMYNGGSEYCDTINPALVAAALAADGTGTPGATASHITALMGIENSTATSLTNIKYGANGLPNFRDPFHQTYNFSKVLPNTGATYSFDEHNLVYITYDQSFSAPKTDDLYTSTPENVQPETTTQYALGYRYQGSALTGSVNLWDTYWTNHIVSSVDPTDPTLSIDRNVGNVELYGLDLEGAYKWTENFTVYASGTFMKSQLLNNYLVSVNGISTPLPVKGKQLVMSPNQEVSVRAQYDWHDFSIGLQAKYEGQRYLDDVNTLLLPGFTVFNLDAEYHFVVANVKSTLQLNVYNLFDASYYSRAGTASNYTAVPTVNGTYGSSSGPFVYVGAPTTAYITLKAQF